MRKKTVNLLQRMQEERKRGSMGEILPLGWKSSTSTPHCSLPKIAGESAKKGFGGMESVDKLESCIHQIISEQHFELVMDRRQKKMKQQEDARKQNMKKSEQLGKKKQQKQNIRRLEERLRELKGQLSVQEKKLKVQYQIQQKMMLQYQQVYDTMHYRLKGGNKRDEGAQTETAETVQVSTESAGEASCKSIKVKIDYRRKFRIIGYAVYFSLAFPKYSKLFRELRRKNFHQNVVNAQLLMNPVQDYFKMLLSFKLGQMQRQRERVSRRSGESIASFNFQQIDQDGASKVKSIPVESISQQLVYLLSKLKENMQSEELDSLLRGLSYYLMNRSFLTDHIFLTDQLYRLKVSASSCQMLLTKQQQIRLLLTFLISKLTCFLFMIAGKKENKYLFRRNSKVTKESLNKHLTRSMLLGGLFLFKKCNEVVYSEELELRTRQEGNIEKLGKDELPVPMTELQISQKFDLTGGVDPKQKRISIQTAIKFANLNAPGVKYKNMEKTLDILNNFSLNNSHEKQIEHLLKSIGEIMHAKCCKFREQHFQIVRQSALLHQHLLTQNLEIQNFGKRRLPNQAEVVEGYLGMILQARQEVKSKKESSKKIVGFSGKQMSSAKSQQSSHRLSEQVDAMPVSHAHLSRMNMGFDESKLSSSVLSKGSKQNQELKKSNHRISKSGSVVFQEHSSENVRKPTVILTEMQRQRLRRKLHKIDEDVGKKK